MISNAKGSHVSPGVYINEKDVTYSVKSLGITSLGLVGETLYGPAFQNIEIEKWGDFIDYFGGTSTEKYKNGLPKYELPYIAKSYLEESKNLNVVRVLGLSGYNAGPCWVLKQKNGKTPVVILRSKMSYEQKGEDACKAPIYKATPLVKSIKASEYKEVTYNSECIPTTGSTAVTGATSDKYFSLEVETNDGDILTYNVSLDPTHSSYIYNVLSTKPNDNAPIYIEAVYENSFVDYVYDASGSTIVTSNGQISVKTETCETSYNGVEDYYSNFNDAYRAAQTPWIVSDAIVASGGTSSVRKLFKFITISDGDNSNYQVKVSIQNIKPEDGTFDVVVRDFYDNDAMPVILERFSKCNLIEGDANYIGYRIGTADGGFVSKSKYILVMMSDNENIENAIPAGFLGYPVLKYDDEIIKMNYNTKINSNIKVKKQYFGISSNFDTDILAYKGHYAYNDTDETSLLTNGFHMDAAISGSTSVDGISGFTFTTVSTDKIGTEKYIPRLVNIPAFMNDSIYEDINTRKFTVCFYGGFDGWDINRDSRTNTDEYKANKISDEDLTFSKVNQVENDLNLPLNLPSTAITSDYYAYLAGYRVFANPQDIDINLLATPGINWDDHALLTEEVLEMIEDPDSGRGGDLLYVMASPYNVTPDELTDKFDTVDIDSSYACTYAPWAMYYDNSNKKYISLPVTRDVVKNMASVDNNSFPWFAPAGVERGSVSCIKAEYKTTLATEDELYENRINPVKTFAKDGVKIWGNKTTYKADSPLNRINVRRLMIRIKKLILNATRSLIFEQYSDSLEDQFKDIVNPILLDVKKNRGIFDFKIITSVTPEARDQHILPAKILIKPTPSLEYISISFVVYPESVNFEE